ncbi:MAG: SH3 domain-containing protein [Gammaproteobacteria bacterium]|nr:SH3 domain-containing protein [Gammaproteobacteria bacterium]
MKKSKIIAALLLFSVLFHLGSLWAEGEYERATVAMRDGDYAIAYCILRPMAEAGDADAQYSLGWMYHNGYGLAINDEKAMSWWLSASDKNHVDAMFSMGMLFEFGDSGEQDYDVAVAYYARAARRGNEDAQAILRARLGQRDYPSRGRLKELLEEEGELFAGQVYTRRTANIRRRPAVHHKRIAKLRAGEVLVELSRQGKWVKVGIIGTQKIGWVYRKLLTQTRPIPTP